MGEDVGHIGRIGQMKDTVSVEDIIAGSDQRRLGQRPEDERVVEELYEKYFQKLLNFILLKIDDPQDAEEILQDTFVSAIDSLPLFSGKSSLFTWLCGIAKHEVADFYRKKKIKTIFFSHFPILEKLASRALGPEEELMEAEIKKRIKIVFRKLSEGYGKILRLKYVEGNSVAQVADILGITLKAAESRLSRARFAFRKVWATDNDQFLISNSQLISNDQFPKNKKENFLEPPF